MEIAQEGRKPATYSHPDRQHREKQPRRLGQRRNQRHTRHGTTDRAQQPPACLGHALPTRILRHDPCGHGRPLRVVHFHPQGKDQCQKGRDGGAERKAEIHRTRGIQPPETAQPAAHDANHAGNGPSGCRHAGDLYHAVVSFAPNDKNDEINLHVIT